MEPLTLLVSIKPNSLFQHHLTHPGDTLDARSKVKFYLEEQKNLSSSYLFSPYWDMQSHPNLIQSYL